MRGLFLYGLHCTKRVWDEIKGRFSTDQIDYVEYPHELLEKARSVHEITSWVYETYRDQHYDFIAGHSMGGAVALELAARCQVPTKCLILIETNLRPANGFYRNFMMPENMEKHKEILSMVQEESKYTSKELIKSLQEDFDFTPYIAQIPGRIVGIYGDRGVKDYQGRYDDLCLDAGTLERIEFKFVPDSCHMPMIEAPEILSSLILESLIQTGLEGKNGPQTL